MAENDKGAARSRVDAATTIEEVFSGKGPGSRLDKETEVADTGDRGRPTVEHREEVRRRLGGGAKL